jgi:hypothetical protein
VLDEHAIIVGHDCRRRARDLGSRAIFSDYVEPQSVGSAASAGFHINCAVLFDVDAVVQFFFRIRADQSIDEFGSDAAFVIDWTERGRPNVQPRYGHHCYTGAPAEQFY